MIWRRYAATECPLVSHVLFYYFALIDVCLYIRINVCMLHTWT